MNFKHSQYLIIATGTDLGKTFLLTQICKNLREKNIACSAIKPIASGFVDGDEESDSVKILRALGRENNLENIKNITPWRFAQPIAPTIAARLEGLEINYSEVRRFCQEKAENAKKNQEILLIESAGGLMTPIAKGKTFLDLAVDLKIPVLLIGGNYLGTISHTLCALEALKGRGVEVEKVIINPAVGDLKIADIISEIRDFCQDIYSAEVVDMNFFKKNHQ